MLPVVLGLGLVALASSAAATVFPWSGHGVWTVTVPPELPCFGEASTGGATARLAFTQPIEGAVTGRTLDGQAELEGEVRGRGGRFLKGTVRHTVCGTGKFRLEMGADFAGFIGRLKFGTTDVPLTADYAYDPGDRYPATIRLAFAAAKRGAVRPGSRTVLVAFVRNPGPQPIPWGSIKLGLGFTPPIVIEKVALLRKAEPFDLGYGVPDLPRHVAELRVAADELLVVGLRLVVPADTTASNLEVQALFGVDQDLSRHDEPPFVPSATATATIPIERPGLLRIGVVLKNSDTENVHIFPIDDPDPFDERTEIPPGGSRKIVLRATPGQQFTFGAGRNGQTLDTCTTGAAVKSGGGNVVEWDPRDRPPFLALACPGGY